MKNFVTLLFFTIVTAGYAVSAHALTKDDGGFGVNHFSGQAHRGFDDPSAYAASGEPDAAAVLGIEPAAGDEDAVAPGTPADETAVVPAADKSKEPGLFPVP